MMKKIVCVKYLLLSLAAAIAFSSCSLSPDDIRLGNVYGVEMVGTTLSQSRVNVDLAMINNSGMKITVREALLALHNPQGEILELAVEEPVVVPRKSSTDVTLPLIIRFKGGLGSLTSLSRLAQNPESVRVSGVVRLKGGCMGKKYALDQVPLNEFLRLIGLDDLRDLKLFF